ncbi:hypothetical protein D3C72_1884110 [compost metagenome]
MRQPVRGARGHRQEATRHLVLALRAAFERAQALGDAEFERLVVGGLEVEARVVLQRAPVAAIERADPRIGIEHDQRAGDVAPVAGRHHQQQVLGHGRADAPEKVQVQIGRRMMLAVGLAIAAVEELPRLIVDLRSAQLPEGDASLRHAAPLRADILALLL